jgi:hypothetical protein
VLETTILGLGLAADTYDDPPALALTIAVRLARSGTVTPQYESVLRYTSQRRTFAEWASVEGASSELDARHPVLRWARFPHPRGEDPAARGAAGDARRVTYDVRVWRAETGYPVELVYEREALPETSHRIEQTLSPSTDYLWTVRARFEVDGQPRRSDWAVTHAPRLPLLPHPFYHRFRMPPD